MFLTRILFGVLALASLSAQTLNTSKQPRALALIGDRYHPAAYIREGLAPAFARENIAVTFTEDVTALSAESLAKYQLFVMLREGRNWPNGNDKPAIQWMTPEQQKALYDYVENGGGYLGLHNVQAGFPLPPYDAYWNDRRRPTDGSYYLQMLGGEYVIHPGLYVFKIHVENKNHPITAGVEDYEVNDEQHFIKYSLDYLGPEHVLLRSVNSDNRGSPAGWWREIGKGRLVYLAQGHTSEALAHPMMQRLLRNSMNWLLKKN